MPKVNKKNKKEQKKEQEKLEKERLEKERLEKERLEKERLQKEKAKKQSSSSSDSSSEGDSDSNSSSSESSSSKSSSSDSNSSDSSSSDSSSSSSGSSDSSDSSDSSSSSGDDSSESSSSEEEVKPANQGTKRKAEEDIDTETPQKIQKNPDNNKTAKFNFNKNNNNSDGIPPNPKLFLGNVSYDATDEELRELVKDCGTVEEIQWATDKEGKFKGFGFLTMSSTEEAQKVLDLPDKTLSGRVLNISFSGGGKNAGGGTANTGKGCFKCGQEGHFSRECPNAGGAGKAGKFGGAGKGNSGGCFKCGQEGHFSRECPNAGGAGKGGKQGGAGKGNSGGCFKCGKEGHQSRDCTESGGNANTVFVGNLSFSVTDDSLTNFLKDCGTVSNIRWGEERSTGKFKGYGFVTMSSPQECQKVINTKHEKVFEGRPLIVQMSGKTSASGASNGACFKCGKEGHKSRDCPNNK